MIYIETAGVGERAELTLRSTDLPGPVEPSQSGLHLFFDAVGLHRLCDCRNPGSWQATKFIVCLVGLTTAYGAMIGLVIGLARLLGSQPTAILAISILEGSLAGAFIAGLFGIKLLFDGMGEESAPAANSRFESAAARLPASMMPSALQPQHEYH